MRVGIIAQWLSRANGGVSESVRLACEALVDVKDLEIICFCAEDSFLESDFSKFPSVKLVKVRSFGPRKYGFAPMMVQQLLAENLDVLHVHGLWSYHARAAWLWQRRTKRPVIVAPHGMLEPWIVSRSPVIKTIVSCTYQRQLLRNSAAVHILTSKEQQDVDAYIEDAAFAEIPNYVEPFSSAGAKPDWWSPDMADKTIFLFLGRIHTKKGILELCEGWSEFNLLNPDSARNSVLVLCGWNDDINNLEVQAVQAGRPFSNIIVPGPQYGVNKARSLSAADFMVLPSKSEGLPMSLLEGFSAGLPALMTDECNLNVAFDRGAALRVECTADSIRNSLLKAVNMSSEDRNNHGKAARELVEFNYSVSMFREKMVAAYTNAIKY